MAERRNAVRIVAAPAGVSPDVGIDAVVVEDDTHLVLGADRVARESPEPLEDLLAAAAAEEAAEPGTAVVEDATPLRIHAIVHDLSAEPTWREEWVSRALEAALHETEARGLRSIALPALGTLHGTLTGRRFLELLAEVLARTSVAHVETIWLVVPLGMGQVALSALGGLRGFALEVRS
ncbi:MAG: macro domain-containing protein [Gemmatimonadales bacterium]